MAFFGGECLDCLCDCDRLCSNHSYRKNRVERMQNRNPEKAAALYRWGLFGTIASLIGFGLSLFFWYVTGQVVAGIKDPAAADNLKDSSLQFLANSVTTPIAVVFGLIAAVFSFMGIYYGISYGSAQKKLNGKPIGIVAITCGVLCLIGSLVALIAFVLA